MSARALTRRLGVVGVVAAIVATVLTGPATESAAAATVDSDARAAEISALPGAGLPTAMALGPDAAYVVGSNGLDVIALDGTHAVHAITRSHVADVALDRDRSVVWLSDASGALVSAPMSGPSDTNTTEVSLPDGECPGQLAVDSRGRVWFAYEACLGRTAPSGLGVYEPGSGFDLAPVPALADMAAEVVVNDATAPDSLAVSGYLSRSGSWRTSVLDVSAASPTVTSAPTGTHTWDLDIHSGMVARAAQQFELRPTASFDTADPSTLSPTVFTTDTAGEVALSEDGRSAVGGYLYQLISYGTSPGDTGWKRRCLGSGQSTGATWHGDSVYAVRINGSHPALIECAGMSDTQSGIGPQTVPPDYVPVGEPTTMPVRLEYRGSPIANARLTISGPGAPADAQVTDTSGSATFTVVPPTAGLATYRISYAGDSAHGFPAYTAVRYLVGVQRQTTLQLPARIRAFVDRPTSFSVRLLTGTTPLSGKTLHVVRRDPLGDHPVPAVVTDAHGWALVRDTPRAGTFAEYVVTFSADAAFLGTNDQMPADIVRLATPMTVTVPDRVARYAGTVPVRVHVGVPGGVHAVSVWRVVDNGIRVGIGTHRTDTHGNLTVRSLVYRNSHFVASWGGGLRYRPRTAVGRRPRSARRAPDPRGSAPLQTRPGLADLPAHGLRVRLPEPCSGARDNRVRVPAAAATGRRQLAHDDDLAMHSPVGVRFVDGRHPRPDRTARPRAVPRVRVGRPVQRAHGDAVAVREAVRLSRQGQWTA